MKKRTIGLAVALLIAVCGRAQSRLLHDQPLRLYYYADDARSFASLEAHAQAIDVLAPQSYGVDSAGVFHGGVPARVLETAKRFHLPLLPLIYNPRFNRAIVSAVLENPAARKQAVAEMAYIGWQNHFTGFQIDFENIDPRDRDLYTQFIQQAARSMHRYGMLLSVALVPRLSDLPFGAAGKPGEAAPGAWAAAFDYRALGQAADFVTVMTYDNFGRDDPPGPVAGLAWVNRALAFASSQIPGDKILMGIPFYGREWRTTRYGYTTRSLTFLDVNRLLGRLGREAQWDSDAQVPWFRYRERGALCTVYFENLRSLSAKLNLIAQYHLKGFAAWRLGSEDPAFWRMVR